MRVLHIEASPRRERSRSSQAAAEFLRQVTSLNPRVEVDHLDIWTEALPEFNGAALDAKYARLAGNPFNEVQRRAWDAIGDLVARVDAADAILLSTPMWNLNVPYRLKHFIDLITQPGLSFRFDPSVGYTPLLKQRPLIVILASSGDFSTGESYGRPDLAINYLQTALRFIGLDNAKVVPVAPTAGPPEKIAAGKAQAQARLASLANTFSGVES
jgi:FMN-dependent NADH-azoreductase